MADVKIENQTPKRRRWLRRLIWTAGVLVVLVVVVYFVATSSAFFKSVVLPKVSNALNADLTVADASLHPFSEVVLKGVKLQPRGADPLLTAEQIHVRYSLMAILGGKIAVDELTIDSPVVTVIQKPDGTSNLDPLLKGRKKQEEKPSKPMQLDIKKVSFNNARISRVAGYTNGSKDSIELANVNIGAQDIRPGQPGKLNLSAEIKLLNQGPDTNRQGALNATLAGDFMFSLTPELKPASVEGSLRIEITQATRAFQDFTALAAKLECKVLPTEIQRLALTFQKSGATLAELRVSGPLDAQTQEGKLKVEVLSLDRRVLNLAGAASGNDFGTTTINSTNQIELSSGGSAITATGRLDVARFQVTRQNQTTPTLDLRGDYSVTVNRKNSSALLKSFNLAATQDGRPLLDASLSSPMPISWGETSSAVGDAALNLTVTNLNLADWRAFAGDTAPEGMANATLKLVSQQAGKQLTFDLDSQVRNLSARVGTNQISGADVHLTARGRGADLKQFNLTEYRLELAQQNQPLLTASGSGTFDAATQDADVQLAAQAPLTRLLRLFPQPDLNIASGTVDFKGRLTNKQKAQTATGQLALADFTARYGNYRFDNFGAGLDFEVAARTNQIEIRKATGTLRAGANAGGRFDASGNFDPAKKSGQIKVTLTDFNQNSLRPFLESALGDKKLVSVSVNATASGNFNGLNDGALKADLQFTNLVVSDPKNQFPATPLEARVGIDAAVSKQVAQVKQCQLTLSPTARAKNELDLKGTVDFSKTNAITGTVKLTADSLDVTRYYEVFSNNSKAAETKPAAAPQTTAAAATPAPAPPEKEPDAVKLPLKNFTAEVNIRRFYLSEVEITNLLATAKIDGAHIVLKPCQLALNGAPVSATVDCDLGVPGFKYDVTFNAAKVPLAPLVDSFQPERKGQIGGVLTASAQIKGAGITGASLQKNLNGQFDVAATNLNLSVANVRSPILNTLVNVIVGIPDLIRNPTATLGNAIGRLTGTGAKTGGWADEFTAAPIDVVSARGSAGNGQVTLQEAVVRSAAFQAKANGPITLAAILTNSTMQIPVTVALKRSVADKVGLVPAGTPTNAAYAALPDFFKMKGTIGKPEADINKLVLAELAAKTGVGIAKQIGGTAGEKGGSILNAVEGIGGLLGGKTAPPATDSNAPAGTQTNQPPAKQNPPLNLLDLLKGLKK